MLVSGLKLPAPRPDVVPDFAPDFAWALADEAAKKISARINPERAAGKPRTELQIKLRILCTRAMATPGDVSLETFNHEGAFWQFNNCKWLATRNRAGIRNGII